MYMSVRGNAEGGRWREQKPRTLDDVLQSLRITPPHEILRWTLRNVKFSTFMQHTAPSG
jgi:hypothetical protein